MNDILLFSLSDQTNYTILSVAILQKSKLYFVSKGNQAYSIGLKKKKIQVTCSRNRVGITKINSKYSQRKKKKTN